MTDKAPERIWAHPEQHPNYKSWDADGWCTSTKQEGGKWTPYVRADLLEAAQARITGLEAEVSAWRQVRDAVAELEGLGPDWPSHGNAPLAVTSGYALHRQRAASARAEALEEAAKVAEGETVLEPSYFGTGWDAACDRIAAAIRALKEKPNG